MTIRYSMGLLLTIITMQMQAANMPPDLQPALDYARNIDLDRVRANLDTVVNQLQQLKPVAQQIVQSIEPRVYAAMVGLDKREIQQEDFDKLQSMLSSLNISEYIQTLNALLPQVADDLLDRAMDILNNKLPIINMVQSMPQGTIPVSMQRHLDSFLVSAQELPTLIKRALPTLQQEFNALRSYAQVSPSDINVIIGTLKQLANSPEAESLRQRLNEAIGTLMQSLNRLPSRETIIKELRTVEELVNKVREGKNISTSDAQKVAQAVKTVRYMIVDLFQALKAYIDIPLIINMAARRIQEASLPAEVQNILKTLQDRVGTITNRLAELNNGMDQALNALKSELQKQLK